MTRENYRNPSGWADPERLNRLDVLFARLYFEVLADWHTEPTTVPRAWTALFASCYRQDVERV